MEKRSAQINELIRAELGALIAAKIELPRGSFLTITTVKIDKELKSATIFLNVFPNSFIGKVLQLLKKRSPYIQHLLNRKLSTLWLSKIKFTIDDNQTQQKL